MRKLFWLSVLLALCMATTPAEARETCSDVVIDDARIFGGDRARVENAAEELTRFGAIVRVRTLQSMQGEENLEMYRKRIEDQCASWKNASGGLKRNMIVVMFYLKDNRDGSIKGSKAAIFYGGEWKSALDPHSTRIQRELMNPHFYKREFAKGFVAGMGEINSLVRNASASPAARLPAASTPVQQPSQQAPPVARQAEPSSSSNSSNNSGMILVILLAVGIVSAIGVFLLFRRKDNEARKAAQQKAQLVRERAAALINQLPNELAQLDIEFRTLDGQFSSEDLQTAGSKHREAGSLVESSTTTFGSFGHSANADRTDLNEAQYAEIEKTFGNVLGDLEKANALIAGARADIETLKSLPAKTSELVERATTAIQETEKKIQSGVSQGFIIPAIDSAALKDEMQKLVDGKKYKQLSAFAARMESMQRETADKVAMLHLVKREVESSIDAAGRKIELVRMSIGQGEETFKDISKTYAASSIEAVRGNVEEAKKRLESAVEFTNRARSAASMERQDWQTAKQLIEEANKMTDQVDSLMRSIEQLAGNLGNAKASAKKEIDDAEKDIWTARTFIDDHDDNVRDELERDLDKADKKLLQAKEELKKAKPDYIFVVKLASEANRSADEILASAQQESEAAERQKERALSTLRNARASISRAKEYIEDHSSDVERSAKDRLREARRMLREAETVGDPARVAALAREAEEYADDAYRAASSDVSTAYAPRGTQWGTPSVIVVSESTPVFARESSRASARSEDREEPGGSEVEVASAEESSGDNNANGSETEL